MILLIDNYDSFTWNLVQRLGELDQGLDIRVVRNDAITPDEAESIDAGGPPSHLIISPGPCTPNESGISGDMIERFAGRLPVLGVCLGHQTMAARAGMVVARHSVPMHGKTSMVHHDGRGVFEGLSNPFVATRYHSLIIEPGSIPPPPGPGQDGWVISAWAEEPHPGGSTQRIVMGVRKVFADTSRPAAEGVQFHPESFLTEEGPRLLANFLAMAPVA